MESTKKIPKGQVADFISDSVATALGLKVDKVSGERLISATEITKLSNTSGANTGDQVIPTTLPASDVFAWAKTSVKPTYTTTEVTEGSGLYFTVARVLATVLSGAYTIAINSALTASDTIIAAFGKLQAQINALGTSKQDVLVSGTTIKTVNGSSLLGSGDVVITGGGLTVTQVAAQTLVNANWTLVSGFYEYNLTNANITAISVVDAIPDNASISIIKIAEVFPRTLSGVGTVKFYSKNYPTGDIIVTINIFK